MLTAFSAKPSLIDPGVAAAATSASASNDIIAMTRFTWRYRFRGRVLCRVLFAMGNQGSAGAACRCDQGPQAAHALVPGSGHLVMEDDPDLTASIARGHSQRLPTADFVGP